MNDIIKRVTGLLLLAIVLGPAGRLGAQEAHTEYVGAQALGLKLRRLGVAKRVLMIGAHPDDESTQILSALALGQGAEVGYLSLTRGEGGQNGIGAELGEGLGLVRTGELLGARRLDGARQFFTRAYDYGFSKSADEAFRHWPKDTLLADVVAVIREFRPDVVISVFTGTPADGHGQHQAAGILARQAFDVAGDPTRFPEQIRNGLAPFAPKKLYQGVWSRAADADAAELSTGTFDALLGRSYFQVAMASRSRHRSQDMGRPLTPGPEISRVRLALSRVGPTPPGASLFAGVDTTLSSLAARAGARRAEPLLARYEASVSEARGRFNPLSGASLVPALQRSHALLDSAAAAMGAATAAGGSAAHRELALRVREEQANLRSALALSAGLVFDVVSSAERVVPGQPFELSLRLWNGGAEGIRVGALEPQLPAAWRAEALDPMPATVAPGTMVTRRFRLTVPADARVSEPYFLRAPRSGDLYVWPEGAALPGAPFEASEIGAAARVVLGGAPLELAAPARARLLDKMVGELERPVWVVPAVALDVSPSVVVVPLGAAARPAPFTLQVHLSTDAPAAQSGSVRLVLPAGWKSEPEAARLKLGGAGQRETVEFRITPAPAATAASVPVRAVFRSDAGESFGKGFAAVDYPHIEPRPLYHDAVARVELFPVRVAPGLRIGYVMGAGDDGPAALAQLGVGVELLDDRALAMADLSRYGAIVTGIRAYEVRPALIANNQRLLEYVRSGGTMLVQYNKYEYTEPGIAPYPVKMARPHGRVTDENAAVALLAPESRALTWPNRIGPSDFDGWVQERGLYHISEWDPRYTPLLEMSDPGEAAERGSLLVTNYGKGTYVYTGLALFRQLPAGVPGAYRLLANLVSLGAAR